MVNKSNLTRRSALCLIGGGAVVAASNGFRTLGFSSVTALRGSTVETANDRDAIIGLFVADAVERNERELLVEVTNNITDDINVTVSLDNETQGTLFGPDGSSGNSVTFSLAAATVNSTDSATVQINTNAKDVSIPFTIIATTPNSSFSFQGTRETVASNDPEGTGVVIANLKNFKAKSGKNSLEIQEILVNSDEFELDRVEYKVTDESGNIVGERTDETSGFSYERNDLQIEASELTNNAQYTLTVRAYDIEGNLDMKTVSDKA